MMRIFNRTTYLLAKKVFVTLLIGISITLIYTGCSVSRDTPTITSSDCKNITYADLSKEIKDKTNLDIQAPYMNFAAPSSDDMYCVIKFLDQLYFDLDIRFIPSVNDCQNYAALKSMLASLVIQQSTRSDVPPAIFVANVYQEVMWADIPTAPMHAVVIYVTNDGELHVWEPQGSKTCLLENYPNPIQKIYMVSK